MPKGHTPTQDLVLKTLLDEGPMTPSQLAEHTGYGIGAIRSALRLLHEAKRVHIKGWQRSIGKRGGMGAIWELGAGRDAPKLKAEPNQVRQARYRERHRAKIRMKDRMRRDSSLANNPFAAMINVWPGGRPNKNTE